MGFGSKNRVRVQAGVEGVPQSVSELGKFRAAFDKLGGYWCHAGGLEPLHVAAPYFAPETRFVDWHLNLDGMLSETAGADGAREYTMRTGAVDDAKQ